MQGPVSYSALGLQNVQSRYSLAQPLNSQGVVCCRKSISGFGACQGSEWFADRWPDNTGNIRVPVKVMKPIVTGSCLVFQEKYVST